MSYMCQERGMGVPDQIPELMVNQHDHLVLGELNSCNSEAILKNEYALGTQETFFLDVTS